jgi:Uma2 family endonuclease
MATVEQNAPPLAAGDKLTRAEFLRRWELHPEIKRAELIGGRVYMSSPLSLAHAEMDCPVGGLIWYYGAHTPGTKAGSNATLLMRKDAPQPDDYLRILPECGGRSSPSGKFLKGAPELIAEVSLSSAAYDLHEKLKLYEKAGVQEYIAVLVYEREVRWHHLTARGYELLSPHADGIHRSVVFPGFWLDAKALLGDDMTRVLAVLQEGLQSREHTDFVAKLAAKRS